MFQNAIFENILKIKGFMLILSKYMKYKFDL